MPNELWIYDVIASRGEGISATAVRDDLAKLKRNERLLVRINSPGGDVFEAVAMHTQLSQWPGGVDVMVDGIAASAASYLATVGRDVSIARDGMLMIHDPWALTVGNAEDHHAAGDVLDQVAESIVSAYVAKSGRSREEIRRVMKAETWLTADGAIEFGLVDRKIGETKPAAKSARASADRPNLAEMQRRLDLLRAKAAASTIV